jgi:hypothetical protein
MPLSRKMGRIKCFYGEISWREMSVHLIVIVYILVYPVFLAMERDKSQNSAPNDRTWQDSGGGKVQGRNLRKSIIITAVERYIIIVSDVSRTTACTTQHLGGLWAAPESQNVKDFLTARSGSKNYFFPCFSIIAEF